MDDCHQPPSDCCCGIVDPWSIVVTVCDMTAGEALRVDLECPYNDPIGFAGDQCVWPPLPLEG